MLDINDLIRRTQAEARPYQERIVCKAFDLYTDKKVRSILLESPTGSGKTVMALLIAKALYEQLGVRIGWVAMRRHLLKQVEHENVIKEFNIPIKYISMFDKDPPKDLDMLVVDEAQHDVTGSMGHIHAVIEPKYILGLSATPFRADRVKLCFDNVIKDAGIATLIKEGYLSPYHHYTIPKWDVASVTSHYMLERERWGKSIIYFHRLVQCREAAFILRDSGVRVEVTDGESDAEQQIHDFSNGKLDVLINCMKLTEGLDIPDLQTVFCRPSCKSVTIQMAGRVLRKHPNHPIKQIVQVDKTPYPFPKTALAVLQHILIDGSWRTLEINKHIDDINKKTIRALSRIEVTMPKFITKAESRSRRWGRNQSVSNAQPAQHVIDRDIDYQATRENRID